MKNNTIKSKASVSNMTIVKEYYPGSLFHPFKNRLFMESNQIDGVPDGITRLYYENGTLKSEINYKNGIPDGVTKEYYENGKIEFEIHLRNAWLKLLYPYLYL